MREAGGSIRLLTITSAARPSSLTCRMGACDSGAHRAWSDRGLRARRRHPAGASLLQYRERDRSRRADDGRHYDNHMTVRTIAVLGAGTMGHGVAHAAASSGFATRVCDVSEAQLTKAHSTIDAILRKAVELGKTTTAEADAQSRASPPPATLRRRSTVSIWSSRPRRSASTSSCSCSRPSTPMRRQPPSSPATPRRCRSPRWPAR